MGYNLQTLSLDTTMDLDTLVALNDQFYIRYSGHGFWIETIDLTWESEIWDRDHKGLVFEYQDQWYQVMEVKSYEGNKITVVLNKYGNLFDDNAVFRVFEMTALKVDDALSRLV